MCRYEVQGLLGQGTFGQVVECSREGDAERLAVKIIKNQQAYFQQACPPLILLYLIY